jgi:DNA topoisomerase-1
VRTGQESIDPRDASTVRLSDLQARVRIGKFGPFVEMEEDGATVTASLPEGVAPADLTPEQVTELVRAKSSGPDVLGTDPRTGKPVLMLQGRFGPYVQLGEAEEGSSDKPRRASLPKGLAPSQMTLEAALKLLSLPRNLGNHPRRGRRSRPASGASALRGVRRRLPLAAPHGRRVHGGPSARDGAPFRAQGRRTRTAVEPIRTRRPAPGRRRAGAALRRGATART